MLFGSLAYCVQPGRQTHSSAADASFSVAYTPARCACTACPVFLWDVMDVTEGDNCALQSIMVENWWHLAVMVEMMTGGIVEVYPSCSGADDTISK